MKYRYDSYGYSTASCGNWRGRLGSWASKNLLLELNNIRQGRDMDRQILPRDKWIKLVIINNGSFKGKMLDREEI